MEAVDDYTRFEKLVHRFDPHARLKHHRSLPGGYSADVTVLEIEAGDGTSRKLIHRLHGEVDLQQNPNVAADEFRVLQLTHAAGLATPAPVYLDATDPLFPTPSLVLEYAEGVTDLKPSDPAEYVMQMARELARIHRMDTAGRDISFLLRLEDECASAVGRPPDAPGVTAGERELIEMLAPCWPLPRSNTPVVLHGDYWPGNTLWQDGHLTAVIDWEDTRRGDPLFDVSNARFEILMLFGAEIMDTFTHHYETLNPVDTGCLPWWDVYTAFRVVNKLDFLATEERDESLIRADHQWFVEQARSRIGTCRGTHQPKK
ncbi:MAG: phosphotransferase [Gemmatimonadetes bacterium]|nr:phosphotransferase [Gemmatimonadota bacterium]MYD25883.1 phosphotransferase [Gemmatimonadota bacterium]MYI99201.1 phosphotransferase [Gemmatimonadota bacterium]